ncbi:hypothetical protein JXQ70_07490 [bacterium]|nr:hypothetical protein [bacterium]
MSGKIKSSYNKIFVYPPDKTICYVAELQQTDHIRIWIIRNGRTYATEYIPFEIVPYLDVLRQRRLRDNQRVGMENGQLYDYWASSLEPESCVQG